ncbi:hypothetical protein AB6A40_006826 [Gnathostoma spinigerum]|uniref:Integrator complex subunit 4/Protein SIEL C-terminal Ig-like domain-containing protein n=1 Tax=Gnathostoma spinigerum TaxID=75299 RepID=A0ABD6ETV4_9BILA
MHGVLVKEQLDTILTVLDDALPDSREALRELLKNAQLESPGCVEYSVKALLNCLQRFPLDRLSVFSCLSKLGLRHASFIQPLVDDLLNLDSTFDVAEPPIDDNFYLAKLILVLNAASEYDPICSLLPDFVVRHYYFLRRAMPELVPSIAALSDDIDVDTVLREISKDSYGQRTRKLLEFAFEQMQCAFKTDSFQQRNFLQKLIIRDMNKMYELDESVAGTARFLAALQQVLMHCDIVSQILVHGGDLRAASGVVDKALLLVNVLESTFRNVDISMRSFVVECRFQLQIQKIAVFLDLFPDLLGSGAELVNVEIEAFRSRTIALNGTMTTSANELIDNIITQINVADKKKIFNGQQLASPFEKQLLSFPKRFPSNGEVAVKWAEIVEPSEDMTDPLRFIAGLPLGISLNILLHNFEVSDLDKFRIEIRYPDQSSNLIQPLKHNFKEISPSTYRLTSSVLLHGTTWSEAAGVHLSCVLLSSQSPILPTSCSMSNSVYTSSLKSSVIPISKSPLSVKQSSVEVTIFPMHKSC